MTDEIPRTCKDCGDKFTIEESEARWFEEKGMTLPKRCAECRKKRKAERESESR